MDLSSFHPSAADTSKSGDKIALKLRQIAEVIMVATCGLFPLYFLPLSYVPAGFSKLLIFSFGLALSLLFFTFSILRTGNLTFRLPWPVLGLGAVALVSLFSAFIAGDLHDSLLGNAMENQTVAFTLLLFVTVLVSGLWAGSKAALIRLYSLLIFSALTLSLWHVARLVFGPEALSFGVFTANTSSLLVGWNGLAIFFGLIILLSLVALLKLPLTKVASYIVVGVSALSLLMLAVIGFSLVWKVLAVVSVIMLLYTSSRHLLPKLGKQGVDSISSLVLTVLVAAISVLFIFAGDGLSNWVGEKTGISYFEVRPSVLATIDLNKEVMQDNLFFGAGPNRFADVWRAHKDPVINQTVFWNTEFNSGFSYIGTSVAGTGLFGAVAWLFFFATLLWYGVRFLFKAPDTDRFWHFIGLSALISTVYLWLMSWLYVPPTSILLLAAITTGAFLVAYSHLLPGKTFGMSVEKNRNYGFVLIAAMVVLVTGASASLYIMGQKAYSLHTFNKTLASIQPGDEIEKLEQGIVKAFNISGNDAYVSQLAYYQWLQMATLLNVAEPTNEQRQRFENAVSNGISSAELAISLDPTEPASHQLLGRIYSVLAQVGVEGAKERAMTEFDLARQYDPQNPVSMMLKAELELQTGNVEAARAAAEEAVRVRPTYTEAIYLLTQLDINAGNTDQALARAVSLVQLEPQNPARRYQVGILLASLNRIDEAVTALEQAVSLDPQYANARYFLALGYAEQDRVEDAIEQLTIVRNLNEENNVVDSLIEQLQSGGDVSALSPETVEERDPATGAVTEDDLETDLVTSSNTVTEGDDNESSE